MREKIKNIYKNKFGRKIFIPGMLLLSWLLLTLFYIITFDTSFSIWSFNHPKVDFTKLTFNKLYQGNVISGNFVSKDKNLGIVALRFQTYIRPPYVYEDSFIFKLREKGSKKWFYENIYRSGLIYDVPFFPFGFPQIENSMGKTYEFELSSLKGNKINALSISNRYPILVTKYKYSKTELLNDKSLFAQFFIKKIYNAFLTPDIWFSSVIYLLPFLFYVFWIVNPKKWLEKFKNNSFYLLLESKTKILRKLFISNFNFLLFVIILIDIFIIQLNNDLIYIVILVLWLITLRLRDKDIKWSFAVAILFLLISPILLFFKLEPTAEKATIWSYAFFLTGTIQIFLEFSDKKSSNNRLGK